MKNHRLGCLSPLALLSAFITLVILIVAEVTSGNSMFSPGALHTTHAETGKDCGLCHAPFWSSQRMSDLCLDCHVEIRAELADPTTLHGVLFRESFLRCQGCHTEHAGLSANLTVMETVNFPHELTGFALTGHVTRSDGGHFTCDDCHPNSISAFDQQTCQECHLTLDPAFTHNHSLAFGLDCLVCHDGVDRYGEFDHSQAGFALLGAHIQVACSGCHLDARTIADLQTTPATCESCHLKDDPHAGRFGAACGVCHSTVAWKPADFDHSLSVFPLDGAHVTIECAACHKNEVFKGAPHECAGCHADPLYHLGLFPGQACSHCHTTSAWRPALYDGLHPFPMDHGEKENTCADCHQPDLTQLTCYTCHERAEIEREHIKEGISNFSDCLRCHPTGQENEAENGEDDDD